MNIKLNDVVTVNNEVEEIDEFAAQDSLEEFKRSADHDEKMKNINDVSYDEDDENNAF